MTGGCRGQGRDGRDGFLGILGFLLLCSFADFHQLLAGIDQLLADIDEV